MPRRRASSPTAQRLRCGKCRRVFDWTGKGRQPSYCGDICRRNAWRERKQAEAGEAPSKRKGPTVRAPLAVVVDPDQVDRSGEVESATRAELADAGQDKSAEGLALLVLARRIDASDGQTGSGLKAMISEWRSLRVEALRTDSDTGDEIDELRAKRASTGGRR